MRHALLLFACLAVPCVAQSEPDLPPIAIDIQTDEEGLYRLDEERVTAEELLAGLKRAARRSLDPQGLSTRRASIRAGATEAFADVLAVLVGCMNARIWDLEVVLATDGEERVVDLPLPRDAGAESETPTRLPSEVKVKAARTRSGCTYLFGTVIVSDHEELRLRIERRHNTFEKKVRLPVDVYGTDDVEWQHVFAALEAAREAGCIQVRLGVGKDNAIGTGLLPPGGETPDPDPAEDQPGDGTPRDLLRGWTSSSRTGVALPDGSREAIASGLAWLAGQQAADGSWSCGDEGVAWGDTGLTGLTLMAFLGAGNTHRSGEHKAVVKRAIRYLQVAQTPDGCYGAKEGRYVYNHALGTHAMVDAYLVTGKSVLLRASAQKAVTFLAQAQNPGRGWRYAARGGSNDTSVTSWAASALGLAALLEFEVPPECAAGARAWFDSVTDDVYHKVGYSSEGDAGSRPGPESGKEFQHQDAMTAAANFARIVLGSPLDDPQVAGGIAIVGSNLPVWDEPKGTVDLYYWFHGAQLLHQQGGEEWRTWNEALTGALLPNQVAGDEDAGSWPPVSKWSQEGGRVYATTMAVLALEVPARYPRFAE